MADVSPLDELRILHRYAGSTRVGALYKRMEELSECLGYGRDYWRAIRESSDEDVFRGLVREANAMLGAGVDPASEWGDWRARVDAALHGEQA